MDSAHVTIDVRDDFPILGRRIGDHPLVYLDNAATSLKPRSVVRAMTDYYEQSCANIHRGKNILSEEASSLYEEAREKVADYVGSQVASTVFVRNTTEAINLVAGGIGLQADDLVVCTMDAHHSNLLPWRTRARTTTIPVDSGGALDLDAYESALSLGPKLVALTACSNVTGIRPPVKQMIASAHEAGALVLVDAAQSMPHGSPSLDADFVAFSAHKMCGPTGIGVLYGNPEAMDGLVPTALGGGTVDWVDEDGQRMRRLPHRLEYGTPDIAGVIGFGAAIDYLESIGPGRLAEHDAMLAHTMVREAAGRPGMSLIGNDETLDRSAVISLRLPDEVQLEHVARALSDSMGVMTRSGHMCSQPLVDRLAEGPVLRFSGYLYNTSEEVEQAFQALDVILGSL